MESCAAVQMRTQRGTNATAFHGGDSSNVEVALRCFAQVKTDCLSRVLTIWYCYIFWLREQDLSKYLPSLSLHKAVQQVKVIYVPSLWVNGTWSNSRYRLERGLSERWRKRDRRRNVSGPKTLILNDISATARSGCTATSPSG